MKTFVLTVSRTFPKTHKRAGQQTNFIEKIICGQRTNRISFNDSQIGWWYDADQAKIVGTKIHTIRANYDLWAKRVRQINKGKAILSIRYWSGEPYNSKQIEVFKLSKIGLQKLNDPTNFVWAEIDGKMCNWEDVAKNDGLSFDDFCDWFKVRQNNPMAIIHFTEWLY